MRTYGWFDVCWAEIGLSCIHLGVITLNLFIFFFKKSRIRERKQTFVTWTDSNLEWKTKRGNWSLGLQTVLWTLLS